MRGDLLPDAVNIEEMSGPAAPDNPSTDGSRQGSLATPTVSTGAHNQKDGSMIPKLDTQVKQWRTPSVAEVKQQTHSTQVYLQNQVGATDKQWATPRANKTEGYSSPEFSPTLHQMAGGASMGRLSPRWVETLMNLPVGWTMPSCASPVTIAPTNCACSETASSQPPQNAPSAS